MEGSCIIKWVRLKVGQLGVVYGHKDQTFICVSHPLTDYRVVHLHVWHNIAIYQHKCWQCVHTSRRSSNVRLRDGHRQMDKIKQFGFF